MFSLSKWIKARKEEKANERRAQVKKDIKEAADRLGALGDYATVLVIYGQEIKNGQQFFDFMFEDEAFTKVYNAIRSGDKGVA